jgi:hypothetical protein
MWRSKCIFGAFNTNRWKTAPNVIAFAIREFWPSIPILVKIEQYREIYTKICTGLNAILEKVIRA